MLKDSEGTIKDLKRKRLFFYCSFYIVTLYLQDKYKDEEHNTTKQGQNIHKKVFYLVKTWLYYFTCYNCNNFYCISV